MDAIIISGMAASGKTSVSKILAERLKVPLVGGGTLLRGERLPETSCFQQFPPDGWTRRMYGKNQHGSRIIGGIVAGIVADILGYLVDGILLAPKWANGMKGGMPFFVKQWIWFNLLGLVSGIALIWIYAAIRPRFGAGVKTAVCAGLAVWVVGTLLPNRKLHVDWRPVFASPHAAYNPRRRGRVVVGAIAGAALYKE